MKASSARFSLHGSHFALQDKIQDHGIRDPFDRRSVVGENNRVLRCRLEIIQCQCHGVDQ